MEMLNDIIETIEKHLRGPLDLARLEKKSGWNKYYLHHAFKLATGLPLIEYVRGRKLTESLKDLSDTNLGVVDIACEYGYGFEQSYIRAFKSQFGMTPSAYRANPVPLRIITQYDCLRHFEFKNGILFMPQFVRLPAITLAGKRFIIYSDENYNEGTANIVGRQTYEELLADFPDLQDTDYYGYVEDSEETYVYNTYMPAVHITAGKTVSGKWETVYLPAGQYAKFVYIGFHSAAEVDMKKLAELYGFIEGEWADKIDRSLSKIHFEQMEVPPAYEPYCEMGIHYPII
ncbi:helix-turn-helix domain-containing protein [Brucepastera parasyntrophica]|uniref:helix-turn-helix domain-containing protein n=1 Tax=Brucepastera parasyntrophica TaxID=2880008 RepID=UPI00210BCBD1|nr:helix-turn-helix domain-containing protein [Brucepastera parasyntrophica]ULQ59523.1 helix-turn-helix domain-containing protein [Brucepastera parasyntrophica]